MNATTVALIVAPVAVVAGPVLLAALNARTASSSRREEWARQDEVAKRAADAVATRERDAADAAAKLLASNVEVARIAKATAENVDTKLDVIHVLVNSNLTELLRQQLIANELLLVALREIVALHQANGRDPSAETLTAITETENKIAELKLALADRTKATQIADAQLNQGGHP